MPCNCGGGARPAATKVTKYVVVYDDGTRSAPYATALEAATERRRAGATAPVETVLVDP